MHACPPMQPIWRKDKLSINKYFIQVMHNSHFIMYSLARSIRRLRYTWYGLAASEIYEYMSGTLAILHYHFAKYES